MEACPHMSSVEVGIVLRKLADPSTWSCDSCDSNTESVWCCLSCSHIGCGRSQKQRHAVRHFRNTQHPLVLHINQKMLYCYECNDWVICDTSRGEIALIRSALDALQDQVIPASRTRAGSVIRMSQPVFQFVDKTEALDMKDRLFTIKKHYEQVLCRRVLRAWNSVVRTPDASETLDDELRQFHGRTGLRNIGNTCLSSYQNATLTSLSCLGVFRELVRRLPELHRVGGQASSSQWYMLAMLPISRRPSEDIYAEAQNKPKRLSRRARQKAAFDAHKFGDSNKQIKAESDVSVLLQLHNLLRVLWSGKWAGVTPMSFVKTFVARVPQFRGYRQHDAHEFLMALLDQVHSELRELPADGRYSPIQSGGGGVVPPAPRSSLRLFVQHHFQSVQVSRTRCHRCRAVSKYVFPGAHAITLDIAYTLERLAQERKTTTPRPDEPRRSRRSSSAAAKLRLQEQMGRHSSISCSLVDLLHDLVAPTRLTGNCLYRCNTCQDLTEATKVDSFDFLSSVVVFHLNRTQWNSRGKSKITQRISFPLHKLDLTLLAVSSPTNAKQGQAEDGEVLPASLQSSPTSLPRKRRRSKASSLVYNLRAMVVHHGKQIDEGHYTSICYSDAVHEWVAFNDLKAEIISEANVLQHEGHDYLLFYERVVE